jgi:hypothetical protein
MWRNKLSGRHQIEKRNSDGNHISNVFVKVRALILILENQLIE